MGDYTYITGHINNITVDEIMDCLADRYSGVIVKEPWGTPDRGELVLFPVTKICTYKQENGGVALRESVKWCGYDYGVEHIPGFSAIEEVCRNLGDSVLNISSDLPQEKTRTEEFPPKARKRYPPNNSNINRKKSARLSYFFIEDILKIKDIDETPKNEVVLPEYVYPVSHYIYSTAGKFLRSKNLEDIGTYYQIYQLCMQLAADHKRYDLAAMTAETFSQELNRLLRYGSFRFGDVITKRNLNGLAGLFKHLGNMELARYCRNVAVPADRWYEIRKRICDINGHIHTASSLGFTPDGIKNELFVSKDYGWGFRNFASVDLQVQIDNDGVHISKEERDRFESDFVKLDFPHAAKVMGWYISDENIAKGLAKPDLDSGRAFLLGHLYRTKKDSLRSILPEAIDEDRLFSDRKKELAEQFWKTFGTVMLNVPYHEKDVAKQVGARWNESSKHWVMNKKDALEHADPHWIPDWFRPVFDSYRNGNKNGSASMPV